MANTNNQTEFIPLNARISVAAGDAACAMLNNFIVSVGLTYFFTTWRGLDAGLAATAWIIFMVWNAVNDPLFGYLSDNTHSHLGRRIPYIRYGAPLFALIFVACWINWSGNNLNQWLIFSQMLLLLFLFDSFYTAIATSLYVMPYEMAISNKARSDIFIWKIIFAVFPMAVPILLFNAIKPGAGEDASSFQWIMAAIGISMGIIIFVSTYFYQEKHQKMDENQPSFLQSLIECFRNRSFLVFEVISFTMMFVQTALMLGLGYYLDEFNVNPLFLFISLGIGILVGIVCFIKYREALGVKQSVRVMTLLFSIGCFIVLLLGANELFARAGFFLFGIGFSGGMYLIPLMNGDVVDMDEHRTGMRREGMYAGVNSFITKPAISFANSIFLWFLKIKGYDFNAIKGGQSASAEYGILLGWLLFPALLMFLSYILLHWYPLAGEKWEMIKQELAQKHMRNEAPTP